MNLFIRILLRGTSGASGASFARQHPKAFTLVEMLVVTSILAIILGGLYTSFQTGLRAYSRAEENLLQKDEGDIFLDQLAWELRHAVPYRAQPFVGEKDSIAFPAYLRRYTAKGFEENLFFVEYKFKGGSFIRQEKRLEERFRKGKDAKETLFEKLEAAEFDYLYMNPNDELEWNKKWTNEPYVGLPRGVRIKLSGDTFGEPGRVVEVLLPQGALLKRYQ